MPSSLALSAQTAEVWGWRQSSDGRLGVGHSSGRSRQREGGRGMAEKRQALTRLPACSAGGGAAAPAEDERGLRGAERGAAEAHAEHEQRARAFGAGAGAGGAADAGAAAAAPGGAPGAHRQLRFAASAGCGGPAPNNESRPSDPAPLTPPPTPSGSAPASTISAPSDPARRVLALASLRPSRFENPLLYPTDAPLLTLLPAILSPHGPLLTECCSCKPRLSPGPTSVFIPQRT